MTSLKDSVSESDFLRSLKAFSTLGRRFCVGDGGGVNLRGINLADSVFDTSSAMSLAASSSSQTLLVRIACSRVGFAGARGASSVGEPDVNALVILSRNPPDFRALTNQAKVLEN